MEKDEIEKITASLDKLIEQVDCNIMLVSFLKAKKAIGVAEECQLNTYANTLERSNELLKIMFKKKNGYNLLVEGLRRTRQTGALKTLQESTDLEPTHSEVVGVSISQFSQMQIAETSNDSATTPFKQIPFQTKEAVELFTGRRNELDVLLESLLPDGGTASIIGIGGIGKTELAKMLLQTLDGEEAYENIFKQIVWINCESTFTATTDFTTIAKDYLHVPIFGVSSQNREISSILNDVYDKLQQSKSLVVLDNVETREILQMCMPKTSSKRRKLSILITSQNSALKIGTHISLGSLELHEAIDFLKKGLGISVSVSESFESGISELVLRLEMFPLAISQAIGYIKEKMEMHPKYKLQDYLGDLDRIPQRILDGDFFIDVSSQGKTTYKTLVLALIKIEACQPFGSLATKILSKVAFMAPDNIPSSLFLELVENDTDAVEGALVLIRRFSIIKYMPVEKISEVYFSIHRLVQDVLRIRIAQQNKTESSIHSIMTTFSLNLQRDLINHALETWRHATKIHSLVAEFSTFPLNFVDKMFDFGQISDAVDFATSSLIVFKKQLCTEKHAKAIFWLQTLKGYYLGLLGKFSDSLEFLETTLNEAKQYLHKNDFVILKLRYYIAFVCLDYGQNEKAALICDELYKDFKLGNIASLRIIYEIGCLQRDLRRFENALETANYILENLHLILEKTDREIFEHDTTGLLASIHGRMENYSESINLYGGILQTQFIKRKVKGLNYDIWKIFHGMGTCQFLAGRFEEAHDSYQKALNELSERNEKDCIWILAIKCNMSSLILELNMVDEALPFCIEVHEQIKKVVGKNHILALESLANIGMAYSKIGRHEDAVSILTKLVKRHIYTTQCSDATRFVMSNLVHSLEEIENFERAIAILNDLRLKCLEYPNDKFHILEQVETTLKRLKVKAKYVDK